MASSPGMPSGTCISLASTSLTSQNGLCVFDRRCGTTPTGMRFDEQGGQPVSVAPNVLAYGASRSCVMRAMRCGATRSAITPHSLTPQGLIARVSSSSANASTMPGMISNQPSDSSPTRVASRVTSKPSTTTTLPPFISVPRESSAAPM